MLYQLSYARHLVAPHLMVQVARSGKTLYEAKCADVAELVDALVLGTSAARRGGSSPFVRTKESRPLRLPLRLPLVLVCTLRYNAAVQKL